MTAVAVLTLNLTTCINPTLKIYYSVYGRPNSTSGSTDESSSSSSSSLHHQNHRETPRENAAEFWFRILVVIICIFGVAGNVLNLAVLTRRRLLSGMDRLEKSATYGLIALAASDLLFCLCVLPHSYLTKHVYVSATDDVYRLYYRVYGIGLINLFLMISTWLIVCMAINRYIAVVYPFHARISVGSIRTVVAILLVYAVSCLLTIPFFLHVNIVACFGHHGESLYEVRNRFSSDVTKGLRHYIQWVWPVFAEFVPIVTLAFCNFRLVKELHAARTARRITCRGQAVQDENIKVTLTLVVIVILFLVLVAPSEVLRYVNPYKYWGKIGYIVANVTNVMQASNFALNFVLYCLINPKFRHTLKNILLCRWEREHEKYEMQTLATQYSQIGGTNAGSNNLIRGDLV